jgi:hypothetical protein
LAVTEHTYALFVLVGINLDEEANGLGIRIETNLKSRNYYGGGKEKWRRINLKKFVSTFFGMEIAGGKL